MTNILQITSSKMSLWQHLFSFPINYEHRQVLSNVKSTTRSRTNKDLFTDIYTSPCLNMLDECFALVNPLAPRRFQFNFR